MKSGKHEDSKTSSEENDRSENVNNNDDDDDDDYDDDDAGTGRSYECMFCKRGFTTAQALGGHMNIHRKDRAKIKHPSSVPSVPSRVVDEYGNRGFSPAMSSYQPHHYAPPKAPQSSYHMYLPPSASSATRHPRPLSMYDKDWRTSLSLQIGHTRNEDIEEERTTGDGKEDELDLELRLGHDP